jgi:hypothetical protein
LASLTKTGRDRNGKEKPLTQIVRDAGIYSTAKYHQINSWYNAGIRLIQLAASGEVLTCCLLFLLPIFLIQAQFT